MQSTSKEVKKGYSVLGEVPQGTGKIVVKCTKRELVRNNAVGQEKANNKIDMIRQPSRGCKATKICNIENDNFIYAIF